MIGANTDGKTVFHGIEFDEQGVTIAYSVMPDDVRMDGSLVAVHSLRIDPTHPNYSGSVREILDMIEELLDTARRDFVSSKPYVPDEDDDDDRGMGDGP